MTRGPMGWNKTVAWASRTVLDPFRVAFPVFLAFLHALGRCVWLGQRPRLYNQTPSSMLPRRFLEVGFKVPRQLTLSKRACPRSSGWAWFGRGNGPRSPTEAFQRSTGCLRTAVSSAPGRSSLPCLTACPRDLGLV